ncbi:mediator of RNA polymerase II transcription subunit 16-like isoform X1 [Haliotis cracherodii]|uniref:mediator of RNA polymerase II transcription subunit 16-like isoform X1 n=2 Tax=Haliotis cracherodii TaxID=6455 RepID=UPI0039E7DB7F
MELVYSLDFRALPRSREWKVEENTCCSLSCRNILAFSRPNNNGTDSTCPFEIQYEVCVLDMDKPWEEFVVCHSNNPVSHIRWDATGWRLLTVDCEGTFDVWQMQDYLINTWVKFDSCSLDGEEVLALVWLHNGIQIPFSPDKRDSVLYSDKFPRTKFKPTLSLFGSKPMEGWVAVTATGLVSVSLLQEQEKKLVTVQENLAPSHLRLSDADVAFTNTGEIIIATSDGLMSSAIQCFTVTVKMLQMSHEITCCAGASLYMKSQMEYGNKDSQTMRITHLMFMNQESSDTLLIGCGSHGYSSIEVWQLVEQTMSLHRMFQSTANPDYAYKTPKWMHKATIQHSSMISSIACPQISVSRTINDAAGFVSYFAAAYRDGSVKILHRQSFQVITTCSWEMLIGIHYPGLPGEKLPRPASYMSTIQQTPSGCGLIGFCGDKTYMFQVFNIRDGPIQLMAPVIIHLLEYVMYVGHDWWDILMIIGQGLIERICQRLMDTFQKQPISLQELLRMRLIRLRIGLYSCLPAGHQKASDCHALLSLFAIASVLKGILRPKSVSPQDKSPAEKLSAVCSKHSDLELDSVLTNLDTDEFIVEPARKDKLNTQSEYSLQPLQPFIQWVADFALHLLSSAPLYQSYSSFLGSSLLRDVSVLHTLRELIVIIRVWGVINPGCLPTFTNMTHIDCVSHIYKLLTKLWLSIRDGNSFEYDDSLMDECCHLPSKVIIPNMKQSFGEENYSFAIFSQQFPLSFFVGHEPDYLYNLKQSRLYTTDVAMETRQHHDAVRHIHLGANPSGKVRECCRCSAMSLVHSTAKSLILKSWEQRFVKMCVCGGHWKMKSTS